MIRILTDSSSNLPTERLKEEGIDSVSFIYHYNDQDFTCVDTNEFDPEEYYSLMKNGTKVTTSLISPDRYTEFFKKYLDLGDDIFFVGMSSGISGSFNSAQIAKENLEGEYPNQRICLFDSRGASLGEGILALQAKEYRDQGKTLDEIFELLEDHRDKMYQVFTVDDLLYLKTTGRCSNVTAILGTLLHIKPILKGNNQGKIVFFDRVKGRKKAIDYLAEKYRTMVANAESQIVGIAHAACAQEAEELAEKIREANMPKEIMIVPYEPVTGAHVGPKTLALFFQGENGVREH